MPESTPARLDQPPLLNGTSKALMALVGALSVVAYLVALEPQASDLDRRKIFYDLNLDDEDVAALEIRRGEGLGEVLRFEAPPRERGQARDWSIVKPVEEPADGEVIQSILAQMTFTESVDIIDDTEGLGFEAPAAEVRVERAGGELWLRFQLGRELPGGNRALLRSDQPERAYVVRQSFQEKLLQPLSDFRQRDLFSFDFTKLESLSVELPRDFEGLAPRTWAYARREGFWRELGGDDEYADDEALRQLHQAIDGLYGLRVIAGQRWDAETRATYGLEPPRAILRLEGPGGAQVARIGGPVEGEAGRAYLAFGERPGILVVNVAPLIEALDQPQAALRSRRLVQLGGQVVAELDVSGPAAVGELRLRRDLSAAGAWKDEAHPAGKIDQDAVTTLRDALLELRWDARVAPGAAFEAALQVRLSSGALERVVTFTQPDAEGRALARRGESEQLYAVAVPDFEAKARAALELREEVILAADSFDLQEVRWTSAARLEPRVLEQRGDSLVEVGVPLGALNRVGLQRLSEALAGLKVKSWVGFAEDEEARARYGLGAGASALAVTVSRYDGPEIKLETRKLLIGRSAEEEGAVYATLEGDAAVFTIASSIPASLDAGFRKEP